MISFKKWYINKKGMENKGVNSINQSLSQSGKARKLLNNELKKQSFSQKWLDQNDSNPTLFSFLTSVQDNLDV